MLNEKKRKLKDGYLMINTEHQESTYIIMIISLCQHTRRKLYFLLNEKGTKAQQMHKDDETDHIQTL